MLAINILSIPWEITPNLVLAFVTLIGSFVTLFKMFKDHNKTKLEIVKQTAFNSEKVEKIEKVGQDLKTKLEDIDKAMNTIKNKQEVDYDYLTRILTSLDKDFQYYRDFIVQQLKSKT
jgi:hypothetical protein